MIELYNSKRPDNGLSFIRGTFYLRYRDNGKKVWRNLRTDNRQTARAMRDRVYGDFLKAGAVLNAAQGRPKLSLKGVKPPEGIYYRPPWQVRIGGKTVGSYDTHAEAEEVLKNGKSPSVGETEKPML